LTTKKNITTVNCAFHVTSDLQQAENIEENPRVHESNLKRLHESNEGKNLCSKGWASFGLKGILLCRWFYPW